MACRAHWSHLRGRHREAFSGYKAATRIHKKNPHAYRMAAEMVLTSEDYASPIIAVTLAKEACKYDERGDWRNQMVFAPLHIVQRVKSIGSKLRPQKPAFTRLAKPSRSWKRLSRRNRPRMLTPNDSEQSI